MKKILLVEDDQRLAELVKQYLEHHDFYVEVASDGRCVIQKVKAMSPDLVVLDIGLPGVDGLTLCQQMRVFYASPILMLTARDSDADEVLGFENGADDYVTKPVQPPILIARIRALLRRAQPTPSLAEAQIFFGALTIHLTARKAVLREQEVKLSSHEFDMLVLLAQQPGEIIRREYIFQHIYNREYDGLDRTVDVRISHLRKKLSENGAFPDRIKTVWGKGYLFDPHGWDAT